MDIQTVFYTLGSIYMLLGIALMIALIVVVWKAYEAVKSTQKSIEEVKDNIQGRVTDFVSSKPGEIASLLGMSISSFIMGKIKEGLRSKRRRDEE